MITKEHKSELINKFGVKSADTGRSEVQVALLTARINDLTHHLDGHKKDNSSRRGLIKLVSKRRKLLDFLAKKDINRYRDVLKSLALRK
ncbi:MAG: 30S ribosomal protein S15 [Bacteroidetes bacterium]|nr:30S ribosomal protein S15 [Bacteroidota bacterium]